MKKIILLLLIFLLINGCENNSQILSKKESIDCEKPTKQIIRTNLSASSLIKIYKDSDTPIFFAHTIPNEVILLSSEKTKKLHFIKCLFYDDVFFYGEFNNISFIDCEFKKSLIFFDVTAKNLSFLGCHIDKNLQISGAIKNQVFNSISLHNSSANFLEISTINSQNVDITFFKANNLLFFGNTGNTLAINNIMGTTLRIFSNSFVKSYSLSDIDCKNINISDIKEPTIVSFHNISSKIPIYLDNFSPLHFSINGNDSMDHIFEFLEQRTLYNKIIYNYFMGLSKIQHDDKTKTAFYKSIKKHEFEEMSPFEYIFNKLAFLIGYGQYPDFICWALLGMYAVNCLVFWKKFMKPTSEEPCYRFSFWSKLLYCLEILVPFFQFKVKSEWQPKPEYRLVKFVLVLSTMIGYICFSLLTIIIIKILIVE